MSRIAEDMEAEATRMDGLAAGFGWTKETWLRELCAAAAGDIRRAARSLARAEQGIADRQAESKEGTTDGPDED